MKDRLITLLTLIGVILIAATLFLFWYVGYKAGQSNMQTKWDTEKLAQAEASRSKYASLLAAKHESDQRNLENEQTLKTIIASRDASIAGLRNVIASRQQRDNDPETVAQAIANTATYRKLFRECSEEYGTMAGRADEVNLVAHGLQGYVEAITK
jgi:hypothetical protein